MPKINIFSKLVIKNSVQIGNALAGYYKCNIASLCRVKENRATTHAVIVFCGYFRYWGESFFTLI